MLRSALLVIASACVVLGLALLLWRGPGPGFAILVWGLVMVAALVFERWRYQGRLVAGGGVWQPTAECFEDPETGKIMAVEFQPSTGLRRYVASEDSVARSVTSGIDGGASTSASTRLG